VPQPRRGNPPRRCCSSVAGGGASVMRGADEAPRSAALDQSEANLATAKKTFSTPSPWPARMANRVEEVRQRPDEVRGRGPGSGIISAGYDRPPTFRHGDAIYSLAFSPDGRHLASGSRPHAQDWDGPRAGCSTACLTAASIRCTAAPRWPLPAAVVGMRAPTPFRSGTRGQGETAVSTLRNHRVGLQPRRATPRRRSRGYDRPRLERPHGEPFQPPERALQIDGVAFSPDGQIATSSFVVGKLASVPSRPSSSGTRPLVECPRYRHPVRTAGVTFTRDGRWLVAQGRPAQNLGPEHRLRGIPARCRGVFAVDLDARVRASPSGQHGSGLVLPPPVPFTYRGHRGGCLHCLQPRRQPRGLGKDDLMTWDLATTPSWRILHPTRSDNGGRSARRPAAVTGGWGYPAPGAVQIWDVASGVEPAFARWFATRRRWRSSDGGMSPRRRPGPATMAI
jgi:hypothetical protein